MGSTNYYKLYRYNKRGQVVSSQGIMAQSDLEALEQAQQLATEGVHELWLGTRQITRIAVQGSEVTDPSGRRLG
jgi:hypothetical protein